MMTLPSQIVTVEHSNGSYPVVIEPHLLKRIGSWVLPYLTNERVIVITDDQVWEAHSNSLSSACMEAGIGVVPMVLPAGEATKSWDRLIDLTEKLTELGVERGDLLLAFGGGVIGDLAGFTAAILKRGCRYIQVPTTLLAQVDSSVGGKTGINTPHGKNLIGAFHPPTAVFADPETLNTLPARQVRAGYAEIVKYGLIDDPSFFFWCESFGPALIAGDLEARVTAIGTSVRAKARIVGQDELETRGTRALLNFGHSFAHALEAETGFSARLLHGEAVALGMALAFRLSARKGLCASSDAARVGAHLSACGLPTRLRDAGIKASGETLCQHIRHDKKALHGRPRLILTRGIGKAYVDNVIELDEVAAFLDAELSDRQDRHAAFR